MAGEALKQGWFADFKCEKDEVENVAEKRGFARRQNKASIYLISKSPQ